MRIETHVHTRYSKDSVQCFWPLYLKCRSKKIDVIAITEHNNIEGGQALSVKLDAPAPCRLDAPDLDLICYASADCLHQHLQVI